MLTRRGSLRIWIAGMACLMASSAVAQERTADYKGSSSPNAGQVRPVNWGQGSYVSNDYYNPYANYEPGVYTNPNYRDPNRGYVSFTRTGSSCPWFPRLQEWQCGGAERRADFGRRFRCSMSFLKPLTYWDIGAQTDIIAVNPGYAHPSDMQGPYAAQGYGGPVTVPLAPNVRSSYNYGWGIPSSRITPITYPAYRQ